MSATTSETTYIILVAVVAPRNIKWKRKRYIRKKRTIRITITGIVHARTALNYSDTYSLSCFVSLFSGSLANIPMSVSLERSLARLVVVEKAC